MRGVAGFVHRLSPFGAFLFYSHPFQSITGISRKFTSAFGKLRQRTALGIPFSLTIGQMAVGATTSPNNASGARFVSRLFTD
jgi:hypothetical protein